MLHFFSLYCLFFFFRVNILAKKLYNAYVIICSRETIPYKELVWLCIRCKHNCACLSDLVVVQGHCRIVVDDLWSSTSYFNILQYPF